MNAEQLRMAQLQRLTRTLITVETVEKLTRPRWTSRGNNLIQVAQ